MRQLGKLIRTPRLARGLKRELIRRRLSRLYRKYQNHTMVPFERYVRNLELAMRYRGLKGCVVECGVWRGGMSAGLAEVLGLEREYFLFDSFEGLPSASQLDGKIAALWQRPENRRLNFDNCTASPDHAAAAMQKSGVRNYHLIKGWFKDTLPGFVFADKIAVLRLDGDWYESTMVCLENLYPHLADGAVVIVDDYYGWEGCTRAVNEFLAHTQGPANFLSIKQFDNDVCYFECRREPEWKPELVTVD